MELSIITINRNNASGLEKTMASVLRQPHQDIEYIVVDGASTDNSVDVIKSFSNDSRLRWISERDNGIYNAMNKGIRMATSEYIMILNSGDYLRDADTIQQMSQSLAQLGRPDIMYGNIIKIWPSGVTKVDYQQNDRQMTLFSFYYGTLNPDGTYIRRSLFDTFGFFDESLKICSDWAWFMKVIALGNIQARHCNIESIYFDMTGISESEGKNRDIIASERRQKLIESVPEAVLADYDKYAADILIMRRIHRYKWAFKIVRLLERVLFKFEKLRH